MEQENALVVNPSEENALYMDLGANNPMISKKLWFYTYEEFKESLIVRIGNVKTLTALGWDTINVRSYNGNIWETRYLKRALYVPEIKYNLFLLGTVLDKGLI